MELATGRARRLAERRRLWLGRAAPGDEQCALPAAAATLCADAGIGGAVACMALERQTSRVLAHACGSPVSLFLVPDEVVNAPVLPAHVLHNSADSSALAWLPDDNGVLAALQGGTDAVLWDMVRLEAAQRVRLPWRALPDAPLLFCARPASGDVLLAVSGPTGSVALIDPRLRAVAIETGEAHVGGVPSRITAMAGEASGHAIVGGTANGALVLWDLRSASQRFAPTICASIPGRAAVRSVACVSPGTVAAVTADGYANAVRTDVRQKPGECVVWRTELPCEVGAGYGAAEMHGMLALPVGDSLLFADLASGDVLGRRGLRDDFCAEAAVYDDARDALLLLDSSAGRIRVQRVC